MKYLIDFVALILLYAFVFFRKWKPKGKDVLLVNTLMYVYLSFVLYFTLMPVITLSLIHIQMCIRDRGYRHHTICPNPFAGISPRTAQDRKSLRFFPSLLLLYHALPQLSNIYCTPAFHGSYSLQACQRNWAANPRGERQLSGLMGKLMERRL